MTTTDLSKEFQKIGRYVVIGGTAWLSHISVANGLLAWFINNPEIATGIGFFAGFLVSYIGHHWWTFSSSKPVGGTFVGTAIVAVGGLLANAGGTRMLIEVTRWNPALCLSLVAAMVPVLTYFLLRFIVFR